MPTSSPTVLKWWIALELRRLRDKAGINRQQVADRLVCAVGKVTHIEIARNLPKASELREMLTLYGASDREDRFIELLKAARTGSDWWTQFAGAAPAWFDLYLGLESSAAQIERYDALVIPGLFQTAAYAEAVIRQGRPEITEHEVNRLVELRLARQELLQGPEPPTVWSVIDESVLYRTAKGPQVMREQLDHLVELAEHPTVTIQVLPLNAGPHAGINGSFILLQFDDLIGNPSVAYTEGLLQGTYYVEPEEIREYRNAFTHIQIGAHKPVESAQIIAQRAEELQ
ncbi:helix-turn-helix domain-containing protein [Haloechinothrix sp. YIM 98757]|uniref:Helix-turn-helix domain-containing protein n=1 Tax=Haloechinothrix aidingensis TaxID=2752311 RepID=A0A838AD83_9PSEU|nr:helix-turn-helix transcriptional regulator [Haloechinothrix aidingensis]MBA0127256.1 helix-turn-helix domain-containing protein [Haloechinothrix aidingensis]